MLLLMLDSNPKEQFQKMNSHESEEIKIGKEVEVVIESVEDQEGNLVLSKQRADFLKNLGESY